MRAIELDHAESTERQAAGLSKAGAPVPFCVLAERQDVSTLPGGEGRSTPSGGLWMTLVWPTTQEGKHYSGAPVLAAAVFVSIVESMRGADDPPTTLALEWPGRITSGGRCVAHARSRRLVLADRPRGEQNLLLVSVESLISTTPDGLTPFEGRSTSLRALGWGKLTASQISTVLPEQLGVALSALETDGIDPEHQQLMDQRLIGVGRTVRFTPSSAAQPPIEGTLLRVNHRGALVIRTPTAKLACRAGELEIA